MKKYVNFNENKCTLGLRNHIKVGDNVIVIDGSYMTNKDKTKENPSGIDFIENQDVSTGSFELLTVKKNQYSF